MNEGWRGLTVGLLLLPIRELGFLPYGRRLRLLARLCVVPPAQGALALVLVIAERQSCGGIGSAIWWLLTQDSLPHAAQTAALLLEETRERSYGARCDQPDAAAWPFCVGTL